MLDLKQEARWTIDRLQSSLPGIDHAASPAKPDVAAAPSNSAGHFSLPRNVWHEGARRPMLAFAGIASVALLALGFATAPSVLRRHTASVSAHPASAPDRGPVALPASPGPLPAVAAWEETFFRAPPAESGEEIPAATRTSSVSPAPSAPLPSVSSAPSAPTHSVSLPPSVPTAALSHPAPQPVATAVVAISAAAQAETKSAPKIAASKRPAAEPRGPERDLARLDHARSVQGKLAELGHFEGAATGIWALRSKTALRAFKRSHDLDDDDEWDRETEARLFATRAPPVASFVGVWGPNADACSPRLNRRGLLPAVIANDGAWAGETSCSFKHAKVTGEAQGGQVWTVTASCSSGRRRWNATSAWP